MARPLSLTLVLDYLLFLLVRLLEQVLNMLPERVAFSLARFIGRLAYALVADRREAAIENLTIAFGNEKSHRWIVNTARSSFEHFGMLAAEFLLIRRWTEKEIAERIVIEGRLPFNLAMMPGNHGICLLTSHFGCFEVSAATTKFLGINLHLIQTGLRNPFLSRYFLSRAGEGPESKPMAIRGCSRKCSACCTPVRSLSGRSERPSKKNQIKKKKKNKKNTFFFGTLAPANEIFARLAVEGKVRVIPLHTYRISDGRYHSVFGEEIVLETTGDAKTDLTTVSQQFHDLSSPG